MTQPPAPLRACWALAWLLPFSAAVRGQGGPPFLTNDPGTPGNGNWEINLGAMQESVHGLSSTQIPQLDINFGVGERIQLTYEVPYVLQSGGGQARQSGWSNGLPGVKWRFLDQGEDGWQMSAFPQLETGASIAKQQTGLAEAGPRWLLPLELTHKLGSLDIDLEAGYYLPEHGARERILGLVVGHELNSRLELDAEIYDDRASSAAPRSTVADLEVATSSVPASSRYSWLAAASPAVRSRSSSVIAAFRYCSATMARG